MTVVSRSSFLCLSLSAAFVSFANASAVDSPTFVKDADPKPEGKKWVPVEELTDEFEGENIDSTKWQTEPRGNGWSWDGRAPGIFQAKNVSIKDGAMAVTVGVLEKPLRNGRFLYKGAIVRSRHAGQPGWYYETRMKANATEMSSTFWLMTPRWAKNKLELDIQECVGATNELTHDFAKSWDHVFHSNLIERDDKDTPKQIMSQGSIETKEPNHSRYFVYGAWWKSPTEVQFFLDGKYVYSITPSVDFDVPSYIQMAIETYDWNPVPADGGMVKRGTEEQRTTSYDWVRVWKLEDKK